MWFLFFMNIIFIKYMNFYEQYDDNYLHHVENGQNIHSHN
jgi:hypothetical protein